MILSFLRISSGILAVILLIGLLILPVRGVRLEEGEITVREDIQILRGTVLNVVAGLGAAVCMAVIFMIVWKEDEL